MCPLSERDPPSWTPWPTTIEHGLMLHLYSFPVLSDLVRKMSRNACAQNAATKGNRVGVLRVFPEPAAWAKQLTIQGCFGLVAFKGRLGVVTRSDRQHKQFRSVVENFAMIEVEGTEDVDSFCSRRTRHASRCSTSSSGPMEPRTGMARASEGRMASETLAIGCVSHRGAVEKPQARRPDQARRRIGFARRSVEQGEDSEEVCCWHG